MHFADRVEHGLLEPCEFWSAGEHALHDSLHSRTTKFENKNGGDIGCSVNSFRRKWGKSVEPCARNLDFTCAMRGRPAVFSDSHSSPLQMIGARSLARRWLLSFPQFHCAHHHNKGLISLERGTALVFVIVICCCEKQRVHLL
jgi:hypothetical protein